MMAVENDDKITIQDLTRSTDLLIRAHLRECSCHMGPEKSECKVFRTIRAANRVIRDGGSEETISRAHSDVVCAKITMTRTLRLDGCELGTLRCALTHAAISYEKEAEQETDDKERRRTEAVSRRCWDLYNKLYDFDECK